MVDSQEADNSSTHRPPTVTDLGADDDSQPTEFSGVPSNIGGSVPSNDGRNPLSSESDRDEGYINDSWPDLSSNAPVPSAPGAPTRGRPSRNRIEEASAESQYRPARITITPATTHRRTLRAHRPQPPSTSWTAQSHQPVHNSSSIHYPDLAGSEDYASIPYSNYYYPPAPVASVPWGQMVPILGNNFPPPPPQQPPPPPQPPQPAPVPSSPPAERQTRSQALKHEEDVQERIRLARATERLQVEMEMSSRLTMMKEEIKQEFDRKLDQIAREERLENITLRSKISELERHRDNSYKSERAEQPSMAYQDMDGLKKILENNIRAELKREAQLEVETRYREMQMRAQIEAEVKAAHATEKQLEELSRLRIEHRVRDEVEAIRRVQEERHRYREEVVMKAKLDTEKKLAEERRIFELKLAEVGVRENPVMESNSQLVIRPNTKWSDGSGFSPGPSIPTYESSVFNFQTEGPRGPLYYFGTNQRGPGSDMTSTTILSRHTAEESGSTEYVDHDPVSRRRPRTRKRRRRRKQGKNEQQESLPNETFAVSSTANSTTTTKAVVGQDTSNISHRITALTAGIKQPGALHRWERGKEKPSSNHHIFRISQPQADDFDSDDMDNIPPSSYADADEESIPDLSLQDSKLSLLSEQNFNRNRAPRPALVLNHASSESLSSSNGSETLFSSSKAYSGIHSTRNTDSGYVSDGQSRQSREYELSKLKETPKVLRPTSHFRQQHRTRPNQTIETSSYQSRDKLHLTESDSERAYLQDIGTDNALFEANHDLMHTDVFQTNQVKKPIKNGNNTMMKNNKLRHVPHLITKPITDNSIG